MNGGLRRRPAADRREDLERVLSCDVGAYETQDPDLSITNRGSPNPVLSCRVGSLANAKKATISIVVKATKPGTLTNTATVTATGVSSDADESATATTTVKRHIARD
jgi:Domain of unknown function DUF11